MFFSIFDTPNLFLFFGLCTLKHLSGRAKKKKQENLAGEDWRETGRREGLSTPQGPEEMCLSLEHENPSKTSEKWVILIALQFRYSFY